MCNRHQQLGLVFFNKLHTHAVHVWESLCARVYAGIVVLNNIGCGYWVEISVGRKRQNTFQDGIFETQGRKLR